jgi:chorismate lyase / 3-hydroxybenzoate synthase
MKDRQVPTLCLQDTLATDDAANLLGAVSYGQQLTHAAPNVLNVPLPALPTGGVRQTVWCANGPFVDGRLDELVYRHNDQILFGQLCLQEKDFPASAAQSPLQIASHTAYSKIFEVLRLSDFPHLARCWNYLPHINAQSEGIERYRQFNIGRQDAFIAAKRSWQVGAPAASALGTTKGGIVVYFLASRAAPQAVENPRQVSAYAYPSQYGPRSPTFSRGSLLGLPDSDLLFISGTASIVGHESLHIGDVARQTEEILRNITMVVEQANSKLGIQAFSCQSLALKVFIRHPDDMQKVARILQGTLGSSLNAIYLQADVCRAELLVEIEAFGLHEKDFR